MSEQQMTDVANSCYLCVVQLPHYLRQRIIADNERAYQLARLVHVGWVVPTSDAAGPLAALQHACLSHAPEYFVEVV